MGKELSFFFFFSFENITLFFGYIVSTSIKRVRVEKLDNIVYSPFRGQLLLITEYGDCSE